MKTFRPGQKVLIDLAIAQEQIGGVVCKFCSFTYSKAEQLTILRIMAEGDWRIAPVQINWITCSACWRITPRPDRYISVEVVPPVQYGGGSFSVVAVRRSALRVADAAP